MNSTARILAIDDSATIRKALQLILEPAGYTVEFGASGQEAVDKASSFRPSLMLLDFILPDFRGTEVCRQLAANPDTAGIPIVLISTKGAEIRQAYHDLSNVVHYITKPFVPDDVTRTITEVLARGDEGRLAKMGQPALPGSVALARSVASDGVVADGESARGWDAASDEEARALAEAWEDGDGGVAEDDGESAAANRLRDSVRRETLEVMFETLRTGLEGVYVEEIDTPAGAAADEAQSYTDLASRLARQLAEALDQAESGVQFRLCSDGSIRSLDDTLLDTYRRVCRLLFRAVGAGAVANELVSRTPPRVLIICRRGGDLLERLDGLKQAGADWHVFAMNSDVRQLPLMTRLYGPSHVVVETAYGSALWDQLKTVRALPEGQRLAIIAVSPPDNDQTSAEVDALRALGIDATVEAGPLLVGALREHIEAPLPARPAPIVTAAAQSVALHA